MGIILKGIKDQIDVKVTAEIDGDCGTSINVPFIVTYKKPTKSESIELIKRITGDGAEKITDEELVGEYVLGWRELPDQNGEPIPFTPENLQLLTDTREYSSAIATGFQQVLFGRKAVIAKNS